jgi:mono/diheme cytochrome c family protein
MYLAITLRTGLITLNVLAILTIIAIVSYRVLSVRRVPAERTPQNLAEPMSDEVMESRKLERSLRWAFTFAVILAAGLPLYWLVEPGRQASASNGFEERAIERGEVLYSNKDMPNYDPAKSLLCANCHGADAAGGQAPFVVTPAAQGDDQARPIQVAWKAPALNDVFARFDEEQVHTILVYGRPGSPMPAWGTAGGGPKNEQAISDLIAYLRHIQVSSKKAGAVATAAPKKYVAEQQQYVDSAEQNLADARAALAEATTPEDRATAAQEVAAAEFALERSRARYEEMSNASEGQLLFETNCARCHTKAWSYYDPSNPKIPDIPPAGSGALGPSLRAGSVLQQFPGLPADDPTTPGFLKQYDWVAVGAGINKPYGVRGISSGQMPHMGIILTKAQIEAIIKYERSL